MLVGVPVAVALMVAVLVLHVSDPAGRPVVLPDAVAGLPPSQAGDFGQDPSWRGSMDEVFGDRAFGGRAYSAGRLPVAILVVARGDFGGVGNIALGSPPTTTYGQVSCTRTFGLEGHGRAAFSRRHLMCWRAESHLTVSVLMLGADDADDSTVAAAVLQAWALQG